MPTPKSKRTIVLQSGFSSTNLIADLNLTMDANFTTPNNVQTVNLAEDTSATGEESSEYQMSFNLVTGSLGVITLGLSGQGDDLASGVSVAKTSATTTTNPRASTGTVTPIASPDAYYQRSWGQPALDGSAELVDQLAGLDVRVKASAGYTVTQTVTSTAAAELVLTYAWKDAAGASIVSGTVKLAASSTAFGSYTLGAVTVTDDPAIGARGTADEDRKTLRERLKAQAKEDRARRHADRHDDKPRGHDH